MSENTGRKSIPGFFRSHFTVNAPVMLTFTLLALIATTLGLITGGKTNTLIFGAYRPESFSAMSVVRMFTASLGHADFSHFASNAALLLILGPMAEDKYGSLRMIFMMLVTSFLCSALHMLISPDTVLLGASGIVFMLIMLSSFTGSPHEKLPVTLIFVAAIYLGKEVIALFKPDGVSQFAHIIGGLTGIGFGMFFRRRPYIRRRGR